MAFHPIYIEHEDVVRLYLTRINGEQISGETLTEFSENIKKAKPTARPYYGPLPNSETNKLWPIVRALTQSERTELSNLLRN